MTEQDEEEDGSIEEAIQGEQVAQQALARAKTKQYAQQRNSSFVDPTALGTQLAETPEAPAHSETQHVQAESSDEEYEGAGGRRVVKGTFKD